MLPTELLEVFDYNSTVLFGIQLKLLLTKVSFEYVKRLLVMISEDINIRSLLIQIVVVCSRSKVASYYQPYNAHQGVF